MKKIFLIILLLTAALLTGSVASSEASSGISICSTAPSIKSVIPNRYLLETGDEVTVTVRFLNGCRHPITNIVLNGVQYNVDTFGNTYYENSSTYAVDELVIEIPLIFDESMGGFFFVSAYEWTDLSNWANPILHTVNTNIESESISVMFEDDPDNEIYYIPLTDIDTVTLSALDEIEFRYSDGSLAMSIDLDTFFGEGDTVTIDGVDFIYDAMFFKSMFVNGVGDFIDFVSAPLPLQAYYLNQVYYYSLVNIADGDAKDFAVDTAYDLILANDSVSDIILNRATNLLVATIQEEVPEYVFPNDYMWVDGVFVQVIVDENGNVMYDSDGEIEIDENGATYGPDIVPEPLLEVNELLEEAVVSLFDILGLDADKALSFAESIQKSWNFLRSNWVLMIVGLVAVLSSPIWIPFIPIVFSFIKTIVSLVFYILVALLKGLMMPINYMSDKNKRNHVKNE